MRNTKDDFRIYLEFDDGVSGIVDLKDSLDGEIFEPLKEESFFKSFLLDTWTIGWSNGADFAPEYLHELLLNKTKHPANPYPFINNGSLMRRHPLAEKWEVP